MHFDTKSYLKSTHNHTAKHALNISSHTKSGWRTISPIYSETSSHAEVKITTTDQIFFHYLYFYYIEMNCPTKFMDQMLW